MNPATFLYAFVLFFVLTPGILITLPPKSKKLVVAATHGLVFALVWTLTHKFVWKASRGIFEGFTEGAEGESDMEKPKPKSKYNNKGSSHKGSSHKGSSHKGESGKKHKSESE